MSDETSNKPPSEFQEGNPVMWPAPGKGDNGETKMALGIFLGSEGRLAAVLRFNRHAQRLMASYVDVTKLRHTPPTLCSVCGEDLPNETPEMKAKSAAQYREDYNLPLDPASPRMLHLCPACAPYVRRLDAANPHCTCAYSKGKSLRCVCPWRRARGFPAADLAVEPEE